MNKKLIFLALASSTCLYASSSQAQQQKQITFTGQVLPQCSFVMVNNSPTSGNATRFRLQRNRGSITTVCNTSSTLSVSIDKTVSGDPENKQPKDSNLRNAKIRFASGGTGIYSYAHQDSCYQEIAIFTSQDVTSARGDTAQVEVNLSDVKPNSIVVFASLTPQ